MESGAVDQEIILVSEPKDSFQEVRGDNFTSLQVTVSVSHGSSNLDEDDEKQSAFSGKVDWKTTGEKVVRRSHRLQVKKERGRLISHYKNMSSSKLSSEDEQDSLNDMVKRKRKVAKVPKLCGKSNNNNDFWTAIYETVNDEHGCGDNISNAKNSDLEEAEKILRLAAKELLIDEGKFSIKHSEILRKNEGEFHRFSVINSRTRTFQCTACDQFFRFKTTLTRHLKSHVCGMCNIFFKDKQELLDHRWDHRADRANSLSRPLSVLHYVSKVNRQKIATNVIRNVKIKLYKCKPCGSSYPKNNTLMRHMVSHICKHCDLFHSNKERLCQHIIESHMDRSFKLSSSLSNSNCGARVAPSHLTESGQNTSITVNVRDSVPAAGPESSASTSVQVYEDYSNISGSSDIVSLNAPSGDKQEHNVNHITTVSSEEGLSEVSVKTLQDVGALPSVLVLSDEDRLISSILQELPLDMADLGTKYIVTVAAPMEASLSQEQPISLTRSEQIENAKEVQKDPGKFVICQASCPRKTPT